MGALLHNLGRKADYRSNGTPKRSRRNQFKAKVALAALRGDKILTKIAQQYEVHPNQVTEWKRPLLEHAASVFDGGSSTDKAGSEPDIKTLLAKIGRLTLENDFLSGALTKVARSGIGRFWSSTTR